jgi:DNA-binding transcriptional LysR family regulator
VIAIIETFEAAYPGCVVEVSEMQWTDAFGPLRRGEVDLMASRLPLRQPDIVVGPILTREPRVLAVSRTHPLAAQSEVPIEQVADYEVAAFEAIPGAPPELADSLVPRTTPSGRAIRRARQIPTTRPSCC